MAMHGDAKSINKFCNGLRDLLKKHPHGWSAEIKRGILRDETAGHFIDASPTGTTIVIEIDGGAVNYRKTYAGTILED